MIQKKCLRGVVAAFSTVAIIGGCTSAERKPAVRAVGSLGDTRTELVAARAQVDDVMKVLAELESRPDDLRPSYDRYKSAVGGVEKRADAVTERVEEQGKLSADYRANWERDNARLTDPTLRRAADERQARVSERYDRIEQDLRAVRAAYDPFIVRLRDLQTVLANDLTYPGVQAARPTFATIRESGLDLQGKVDEVIRELDDASDRMSPTTMSTR